MRKMNPLTIIKCLKRAYSNKASVLPLKVKAIVLSVIVLLLFDNILGFSFTLFTNTKIDTIEHMIESKPKMPESYFVTYKRLIAHDYINHRTLLSEVKDCFRMSEEKNGIIPGLVLITSALLPLSLILIVVYFLLQTIFFGRTNSMEHCVNLLLIFIGLSLCCGIMRWLALQIPMFFGRWIYNYIAYAIINVALLFLLLFILPEIREIRVTAPAMSRTTEQEEPSTQG